MHSYSTPQNTFEEPIVTEVINVVRESTSETLSFSMDFKPKTSGTFGICLDNRNSRFMSKHVQVCRRSSKRLSNQEYSADVIGFSDLIAISNLFILTDPLAGCPPGL